MFGAIVHVAVGIGVGVGKHGMTGRLIVSVWPTGFDGPPSGGVIYQASTKAANSTLPSPKSKMGLSGLSPPREVVSENFIEPI
jgi:uncharacterized membrane protein